MHLSPWRPSDGRNVVSKHLIMAGGKMNRLLTLTIAILVPLLFVACSSSDSNTAYVRVVHASPDAPNVDVIVDGTTVLTDVPFGVASAYLSVDEGERRVQVNVTGTTTTVIDATLTLVGDTGYTVIARGLVADIGALVAVDSRGTFGSGSSALRAIHGAPSAPNVDIYVTAPGADLATATPVLTDIPFEAIAEYLSVAPGEYQVRVTAAGTTTVAIDSGSVNLANGVNYTAIALDGVGGGAPFSLLLLEDSF